MNAGLVALSVLTLSGLKLPIKIPVPGATPASTSGAAAPAIGGGATSDADARTRQLYEKLDYTNSGNGTEADELFSKFGIPTGYNPRMHIANPDPEWIPGWDALQLTDESKVAIAQAAVNRTWTARCHQDYAAYRAAWQKIDAENRPELERLAKGGYYERASGLAALLEKVQKQAADAKALYPAGYEPANVGIVDDIVSAMVALHRDGKREFATYAFLADHKINLTDYREHGRAFADDPTEQDLFCEAATKVGDVAGLYPIPAIAEMGHAYAAVKWPVDSERAKAIHAVRDSLVAKSAPALDVKEVKVASLVNGDLPDPAEPKLYWVFAEEGQTGLDTDSPFKVKSVKPLPGGGVSAEIENVRVRTLPYDCRSTGKVDSIDDNGHVSYQQSCKYQHVEETRRVIAEIRELPAGLKLAPGDIVGFYGDLASRKTETLVNTPPKKVTRETLNFTVRHLKTVKRGAQVLTAS
jgi:hypothetical protein